MNGAAAALAAAGVLIAVGLTPLAGPLRRALDELFGTRERGDLWTRLALVGAAAAAIAGALLGAWWALGGRAEVHSFVREGFLPLRIAVANALVVPELLFPSPSGATLDRWLPAIDAWRGAIAALLLAMVCVVAPVIAAERRRRAGGRACPPAPQETSLPEHEIRR